MSIANSITGGGETGSASQLLDLLANPDAFTAKLQTMQNATAEYKKYVEAVGVATEVVVLRDEAAALKQEANEYKTTTKAKADAGLDAATAKAESIVAEAQAKADGLLAESIANKKQIDIALAEAKEALATAKKAQANADIAQANADKQMATLAQTKEAADQTLAEAQTLKADILAKHTAFIESL